MDELQLKGLQKLAAGFHTLSPLEAGAMSLKLNEAKRRQLPVRPQSAHQDIVGDAQDASIVELSVIPAMEPTVETNELNQITHINGSELGTITTQGLRELAHESNKEAISSEDHEEGDEA